MRNIIILAALIVPLISSAEETSVGYLGVSTEELSDAMKKAFDIEQGLLVNTVHKDTPAEKGGIEVGDIILDVDGEKVNTFKMLKETVEARPNKKVKIHLLRNKKEIKKEIKLEARTKSTMSINFDIPDLDDIKTMMNMGTEELKKEIENLKAQIEELKKEIEELKEKVK